MPTTTRIVYTDHVLAATIDWCQRRTADYAPALLYVSDHGESLGEYGIFLHGLPYPFAPEAQKHVAMIAWLGDERRRARPPRLGVPPPPARRAARRTTTSITAFSACST